MKIADIKNFVENKKKDINYRKLYVEKYRRMPIIYFFVILCLIGGLSALAGVILSIIGLFLIGIPIALVGIAIAFLVATITYNTMSISISQKIVLTDAVLALSEGNDTTQFSNDENILPEL
jgi:hypothetical protein